MLLRFIAILRVIAMFYAVIFKSIYETKFTNQFV